MDKRTLIFVVCMTIALMTVNSFFQYQNREDLEQFRAKQQVKQTKKIELLESEISQKTTPENTFKSVKVNGTTGIRLGDTVLVVAEDKTLPEKFQTYSRIFQAEELEGVALYASNPKAELNIGTLPYFGQYELQIFIPETGKTYFGRYADGHFSLPVKELWKLKKEWEENPTLPQLPEKDGIAFTRVGNELLPVAVYIAESNSLLHLDQIADLPVKRIKEKVATLQGEEQFFVLENDYQQLVFSNHGGALAEINLPFETNRNEESVVKEVEFDRLMKEEHPYNAMFPAKPFFKPGNSPQGPFVEEARGKLGGYYPLIRRDLIESGKKKSIQVQPRYYGLNIVSEYPEMAEAIYTVKYFDKNKIVFESIQDQRRVTKTFTLPEDAAPYCLHLTIDVEGDSRGLWLTSGVPEMEWINNASTPTLKYRITRRGTPEVNLLDLKKDTETLSSIEPDWISNGNGFFGIILDPLTEIDDKLRTQKVPGTELPTRLVEIDEEHERFRAQDYPGYLTMLPLSSQGGMMEFRVFAGPYAESVLKAVDHIYADEKPDYIACQSFHGWFSFISGPFSKFLFVLMKFFHYLTDSWGISIILLTVALRIMLYPLNAWSTKSMIKMQEISPKVTKIQEKHKKDPKKAQLEIMNLYRDAGVNPVSGCFPLLIQLPFLIGMFDLLKSTFELRGATFIPGWINNLASPDVLFSWTTPIPFIGNEFHLLPILLGVVMFVQQRTMSTLPADPSQWTDQQRQQRSMGTMMAIFFTFMFYKFPSGLNIYWLSSMLLGIVQQKWTQRQMLTLKEERS